MANYIPLRVCFYGYLSYYDCIHVDASITRAFWYHNRLVLQLLYSLIKVSSTLTPGYDLLPAVAYIWGFAWVPVALAINELIRRHEIK
jgi:hypothetical protein